MTTREDKRFTASVAAMRGLCSEVVIKRVPMEETTYLNPPAEHVASHAIRIADALLAKLEETAPPVAEDKKCEHTRIGTGINGRLCCAECNVGFIPDGVAG